MRRAGWKGQGSRNCLGANLIRHRRLRWRLMCRWVERWQYIVNAAHQTGPIADQHIASRGSGIHRMSGHSQDFAPLLKRLPCGDKGSRFRRRFHNHNRLAEAENEAISFGKKSRGRVKSNGLLGDARVLLQNGLGKFGVFGRVYHVDAAGMHANGALGQAGGMGGGIYATGQAGLDDQPRLCKTGRKTMGHPRSQGGGIARPHDLHAGARELFLMTKSPKKGRSVGNFGQQAGVAGFMFKNEIRGNFLAAEIFALRHTRYTIDKI